MQTLSARIRKGDFMVACGVSDTLSAKIVEEAGFDLIWLGSLLGTASALGATDIGLMTPTERINQVLKIRSVSSLPVIVDGEEGWGDAPHVAYWVREFARAGAAGIMFDDKEGDFATPYVSGTSREIEPIEVATRKIRAAADARPSSDFLIVARSAARRKYGMEEQLKRLAAYKKAGADILWATSSHPDMLKQYRKALKGPLWTTCNVNSGEQHKLRLADFKRLGIQIVGYETAIYLVALQATIKAAKRLRKTGTIAPLKKDMLPFDEFIRLAGFKEMAETARKYGVVSESADS
ncbi:MAG: isocitrate lyase/PEP mutase family protein [Deltaproteobacteria bacterium]|nr:isocitrate lyase/PEP mutase family protein [Deltaproteobacteria bacterium]